MNCKKETLDACSVGHKDQWVALMKIPKAQSKGVIYTVNVSQQQEHYAMVANHMLFANLAG
jgi:hypothetical protein